MSRPPPRRAVWFRYTDAASVGIEMAVAIGGCAAVALWLERNVTHWSPWTTLLGVAVGIAAATKAVLRAAKTYRRSLAESTAESTAESGSTPDPSPDPGPPEDRHDQRH